MKPLNFALKPLWLVCATVTLSSCSVVDRKPDVPKEQVQPVTAVGQVPDRKWLDQGWSEKLRQDFWYTGQGSQIIPYVWFMWLEQPDNNKLFRDGEHMEMLRYLPNNSSNANPGGLPIGFALHNNQTTGQAWVGMTCAACHTNQLDYKGTKLLIEGAPTLANFVLFFNRLNAALAATLNDNQKFSRFAINVLKDDASQEKIEDLRQDLMQVAMATAERQAVNDLPADYPDDFTSYARLDAFGNIQNAGTAFALDDLNNRNAPTAPVSYPFIWGTHQSDVVQWNASAPNTPIVGPLVRNIGEVVGVFGSLSIHKAPLWEKLVDKHVSYSSTVDLNGLGQLEAWVKTLRPPVWPEQYLPGIDIDKAARGKMVFQANCVSCHQIIAPQDVLNDYVATRVPVKEVGTDPTMSNNASCHMAKTLILEGTKTFILAGDKFAATDSAIDIPVNGVVGLVLKDPIKALKAGAIAEKTGTDGEKTTLIKSIEERIKAHVENRDKLTPNTNEDCVDGFYDAGVYKARPLNGIWATAPYLHNGSVPDLWSLLQSPQQRPSTFWVGSREFDPVKVGYDTTQGLNLFKVNKADGTVQAGNSNDGHLYGTSLSDDEKWQLVEFMKTL
ncbi:di-heme-cytochrome C peroxidase [Pseudoalteromonas fenneropenaei]|uniref:Di-heme-cytochrome C peroxidase n=1 Tax=Pseudoalteromonas fenneropenaei TaxID=1737459 RepID=A0ABV7CN08_9GAMM